MTALAQEIRKVDRTEFLNAETRNRTGVTCNGVQNH